MKFTFIFPLFVSANSLMIDRSPFKPEKFVGSAVLPVLFSPDDSSDSPESSLTAEHF